MDEKIILEQIQEKFGKTFYGNKTVQKIYKKVQLGEATYGELHTFARMVGELRTEAVQDVFIEYLGAGEILPFEELKELAVKTIVPTLFEDHEIITEICVLIQNDMNRAAGIGLNSIANEPDISRAEGIATRIALAPAMKFKENEVGGLIENYALNVVDEFLEVNLETQIEAGLAPTITRRRGANENPHCDYCASLVYEGPYKGPGMPAEIFRRHRYCRCVVLYGDAKGFQDVYSKEYLRNYKEAEKKQREYLNKRDQQTPEEIRLARNARRNELRRSRYSEEEWERRKELQAMYAEYYRKR